MATVLLARRFKAAACVIVQRALPAKIVGQATAVQVADTLVALGDLAHHRRQKIAPKVLAVTGSNGKTTTKEMIAAILEEATLDGRPLRGRVLKTEGNFNNLVGLPLTLLGLRRQHRVAVVSSAPTIRERSSASPRLPNRTWASLPQSERRIWKD